MSQNLRDQGDNQSSTGTRVELSVEQALENIEPFYSTALPKTDKLHSVHDKNRGGIWTIPYTQI